MTAGTVPPSGDSPRPLVSFFVLAWSQEKDVREAIEGAFAQTYEPLEILLSDDNSPDDTFAIMQEMAAAYTGPHKVILNRNPENLGLIGHINRVMEIAGGDFIVQNAGDDVSLPERTQKLVDVWIAGEGRIGAVHSALRQIDAEGHLFDYERRKPVLAYKTPAEVIDDGMHLIGASMGWARKLFEDFGPLSDETLIEDRPIAFRAALTGDVAWIDEPLLLYRVGGESDPARQTSGFAYHLKRLRWDRSFLRSYLHDMERLPPPDYAEIRRACEQRIARIDLELELAGADYAGRLARIPRALALAATSQNLRPLRTQMRYLLRRGE